MINSILLVDDENLFHLVFEDACSLLDITLDLQSITSSDEAARLFEQWKTDAQGKPECVFVDLNIIGSSFERLQDEREAAFQEFYDDVHSGTFPKKNNIVEIAITVAFAKQYFFVCF